MIYRRLPKFLDARNLCYNLPKTQEKRTNLWVFRQKDANGTANIETLIRLLLEEQSDLGLHCLPRPICLKTFDHYGNYGLSKISKVMLNIERLGCDFNQNDEDREIIV